MGSRRCQTFTYKAAMKEAVFWQNSEVASAVMSHPFTGIVFRVGDDAAKKLADGFSYFEAKDLRNLEAGQAVSRVERSDYDSAEEIASCHENSGCANLWASGSCAAGPASRKKARARG